MGFNVGDEVRVVVDDDAYKGRTGILMRNGAYFEWLVRLEGMSDDPLSWWGYNEDELELVVAETPTVGDTVRVVFEGEVDIVDVIGGVRVTTPGGENVWLRNDHVEVISKAVKEPVVLGVGDKVVEGATAPVGALATGTGLTPLMFDGKGWVFVTTPSVYATNAVVLSSYVVTFIPPVIDSK